MSLDRRDVRKYPMGARVTYGDANATVSDGVEGLVTGTVNGLPICHDTGAVWRVPVWTSRDKGREPTTIYVPVENVVSVEVSP